MKRQKEVELSFPHSLQDVRRISSNIVQKMKGKFITALSMDKERKRKTNKK